MLRQRVITALILAGALIAALLFAPYPAQAVLFALVAAAGGWEWAALVGAKGVLSRGFMLPSSCYFAARCGWAWRLMAPRRHCMPGPGWP